MKSFKTFLVEKTTQADALKVLGLKPNFTKDDLATAHKNAVRQYHPDRPGGNAEKMALANDARDVLMGKTRGGQVPTGSQWSSGDREDYETRKQRYADMDAKRAAYAKVARDAVNEHLEVYPFLQHFERIFGENFATSKQDWKRGDATVASYDFEASNKSRTIVLSFSIYVDFTDLFTGHMLSNPAAGLKMSLISDILYNRKKVKLTQWNYRMETEYKVLYDPEVLFPSDKLKAQMVKSAVRKMSKRDVLLTFEKEIGASISGSGSDLWVNVPVGQQTIAFYRMTGFGKGFATWGVNGIYEKHKRVAQPASFVSILEDEPSITFLMNKLRELQSNPPPNGEYPSLVAAVDGLLRDYKAQRGF